MREMRGRGERARQGDTGEGMGERARGRACARGHARVCSLCRKRTRADAGGVCMRADKWAAGRVLGLSGNAKLECLPMEAMEEAAFDSLTVYKGPKRCLNCPARQYGLIGGSCQLCPAGRLLSL